MRTPQLNAVLTQRKIVTERGTVKNSRKLHWLVGFIASAFIAMSCAGCPPQIPNIKYPPPLVTGNGLGRDEACPTQGSTPPPAIPQLCRVSTDGQPTDCNKTPLGADPTIKGKCDASDIYCAGFALCEYTLASNSSCYQGQLRYCDYNGGICDPTTGGSSCGTQPCDPVNGFNWMTNECDPIPSSCGLGTEACCPGNICYDGFSCNSGKCIDCGSNGAACCDNDACNSGLTCSPSSATATGKACTTCGVVGNNCCAGGSCFSGLVCTTQDTSGTCKSCGSSGGACCAGNTCNAGFGCANGACATIVCSPGQSDCGAPGNAPRSCNSTGTGWVNQPACGPSQVCNNGSCNNVTSQSVSWSITTGTDDLRGGSSTATLTFLDKNGNTLQYWTLNNGANSGQWANGSVHSGTLSVAPSITAGGIGSVWLHLIQGSCFGCTDDNWNVDSIKVSIKDNVKNNCLVNQSGAPLVRLTGSQPYEKFNSPSGCN